MAGAHYCKNYSWNHTVTTQGRIYGDIFAKWSKLISEITQKICLDTIKEGEEHYRHFVDNGRMHCTN